MKAGLFVASIIILIILSSCNLELEVIAQDVEFIGMSPANGTNYINTSFDPSWECSNAINRYDFLLGTSPDSLKVELSDLITPDCTITGLRLSTDYYWQVRAYNVLEEPYLSEIMKITTRDPIWQELYPEDGADGLPLNVYCQWSFGSDDIGDVLYKFNLGFSPETLEEFASGIEYQFIELDSLLFSTTYYWNVSTYDEQGILDISEVQSFTTVGESWELESPADGSEDVNPVVEFIWEVSERSSNRVSGTGIRGEFVYELYLGNSEDELELFAEGIDTTSYHYDSLEYEMQYYWQVKAIYMGIQELMSPIAGFETRDYIIDFYPADGARHVAIDVELSWQGLEGSIFDVYFGEESGNLVQVANQTTETSFNPGNILEYSTEYFWRVDLHLENGDIIECDEKSFYTTINPVFPGYCISDYLLRAEQPCNIDIIYQVRDMASYPELGFSEEDFKFLEDGEEIDPQESLLEITSGADLNTTSRLVLMIDNSSSMTSILEQIKTSALNLVDNLPDDQEISVFEFSESAVMLTDFTNDEMELTDAINAIEPGFASTDLYGSLITGVEHWDDIYYPENIIEGCLILITDGSDTQGSFSLDEALEARGNKSVYTIGIGNEIDEYALEQLANEEFYGLGSVEFLPGVLDLIQTSTDLSLDAFYWLHYMTPKRGNVNHSVEISINGNPYTGEGSKYYGVFNSAGFYGTLPGVYVNVEPDMGLPFGIDEYTISDSLNHAMIATTYYDYNVPVYEWAVSDTQVVVIQYENVDGSYIEISGGSQSGNAVLTVTDTANNYTKDIEITSEVILRD